MGANPKPTPSFTLLDSMERPWEFPANKSGSVVLVEFITTTCEHCKGVVPVLSTLQTRFGASGLQVISVVCDELPQTQRADAAGKYARDNNLNYSVFIEPGTRAGGVRDRYQVEGYPHAVLLDGSGRVLWKGHPNERAKLEEAIKNAVGAK
jgi:thiol-disulfide isomerase/thioredoxin